MKRTAPLKRRSPLKPYSERKLAAQRANARKRVYVRNGQNLTCEVCGVEFYAYPTEVRRGRRFCSGVCRGKAYRTQRTCSMCGVTFECKGPRKTCSVKCCNAAKTLAKTGRNNPGYKHGNTRARFLWLAGREHACRICGSGHRLVQHHVVLDQHVRKRGGDRYDLRNSLTLCWRCHANHHHGSRIPVKKLRPENFEFATELLGPASDDYFIRYYADDTFEDEAWEAA